jgi:hypothetical protein
LAKLPNVLDTALLGRMIHNGRIVRQEIKCRNIKLSKEEEAWTIVEMGHLASRYAVLFSDTISMSSFYTQENHDEAKVVHLEPLRMQFVEDYKAGNVNLDTHPIMRTDGDPECDKNAKVEMSKVAAVSCMHHCIPQCCGADRQTGKGCRFDYPKKKLNPTVPAIMQLNAEQMEARVLLRRTCDRTSDVNPYFLKYFRSNHDVTSLIQAAHKMRYATKYVAKNGHFTELLDEVIDYLNNRSMDVLPPNLKQILSHLVLTDCSHRAFINKQELAYKVMMLPEIRKSFQR